MTEDDINKVLFEYLPHWADKKLEGEWVQYAQLQTQDGRKMGNGIILSTEEVVWDGESITLYVVLTDFGTEFRLTVGELAWFFHPPMWRMKASRVKFRQAYMKNYLDQDQWVLDEA